MKHLKVIVSLLLVFALVISISPVQAKADALAVGTVIAGVVGVGLILQAMGVRPSGGSGSSSWQSICSSAYSYLQTLGYATVKGIPLLTSQGRSFVMRDVISALRDWLFSSNTIYSPHLCTSTFSIDGHDYTVTGDAPVYLHHVYHEWSPYDPSNPSYVVLSFAVSTQSFTYRCDSSTKKVYAFGISGIYYYGLVQWKSSAPVGRYVSNFPYSDSALKSYISADSFSLTDDVLSDDLYFDAVKPDVNSDIDTTYADWANRSITVPETGIDTDDPSVPVPGVYYPIYVPSPGEAIDKKTQEELQNPVAIETPEIPTVDPDGGILAWLASVLVSFLQRIVDGINSISQKIADSVLSLLDAINGIKDWLLSHLTLGLQSMVDGINAISYRIAEFTQPFWVWADSIIQTVINGFTDVITGVKSLPDAIAAAIAALFVPSVGFVEAKVEALRAQFGFADSIIGSVEVIKNSLDFSASGPPVVYVNLAAAENGVHYGGLVPFIDMSWYARYKPTGDALLSSFFWVVFAWRTFVHLPGIISGVSGNFVQIHSLEENYYKHNKR